MLFKKNSEKQVNEIMRIIMEEHGRHRELMNVFMDAANSCTSMENYHYNLELSSKERELMLTCSRIIDRINKEVLDD